MAKPLKALQELLSCLEPKLHEGVFVFTTIPAEICAAINLKDLAPVATFKEGEGLSLILPENNARAAGLDCSFRAAWITLMVYSDLDAVGLTAAVATALAEEGISCNMVAALHHDHLFVPQENAQRTMEILRRLQQQD
jgi:hypothetical protein